MRRFLSLLSVTSLLAIPQAAKADVFQEAPISLRCVFAIDVILKRGLIEKDDGPAVKALSRALWQPHALAEDAVYHSGMRDFNDLIVGAVAAVKTGQAPSIADCKAAVMPEGEGWLSDASNNSAPREDVDPAVIVGTDAKIVQCQSIMVGAALYLPSTPEVREDRLDAWLAFLPEVRRIAVEHGVAETTAYKNLLGSLMMDVAFGDPLPVSIEECNEFAQGFLDQTVALN